MQDSSYANQGQQFHNHERQVSRQLQSAAQQTDCGGVKYGRHRGQDNPGTEQGRVQRSPDNGVEMRGDVRSHEDETNGQYQRSCARCERCRPDEAGTIAGSPGQAPDKKGAEAKYTK